MLAQSYRHIEVIVVNDGSNDGGGTARVCARYARHIRYFEKANGGVSSALNMGARNMQGTYFSWLSHDDTYVPLKTELQVGVAERHGSDRLVLLGDWENVDEDGRHVRFKRLPDIPPDPLDGHGWRCILRGHMNGSTMLFHRNQFQRHGYFDESLVYAQDYDFWLRLLTDSYFLRLPYVLTQRRLHPAQLTHAAGAFPEEDSAIWRRILEEAPESAQIWSAGSRSRFLADMADRLDRNGRKSVAIWARQTSHAALRRSLVSIIVPVADSSPAAADCLREAIAQTYPELEIVVVGSKPVLDALAENFVNGTSLRFIVSASMERGEARSVGVEHARGEYLAFLDPGFAMDRGKVERQVTAMQSAGTLLSLVGWTSDAAGFESNRNVSPRLPNRPASQLAVEEMPGFSALMLHRCLLATSTQPGPGRFCDAEAWVHEFFGSVETTVICEPLVFAARPSEEDCSMQPQSNGVMMAVLTDPALYQAPHSRLEDLEALWDVAVKTREALSSQAAKAASASCGVDTGSICFDGDPHPPVDGSNPDRD